MPIGGDDGRAGVGTRQRLLPLNAPSRIELGDDAGVCDGNNVAVWIDGGCLAENSADMRFPEHNRMARESVVAAVLSLAIEARLCGGPAHANAKRRLCGCGDGQPRSEQECSHAERGRTGAPPHKSVPASTNSTSISGSFSPARVPSTEPRI